MKKVLTDYKTGEQMTILYDDKFLPAFGEDGTQYFIITRLLVGYFCQPRDDCKILDLKNNIAIMQRVHPAFGITEPMKFLFDKDSFDKASSIEEYVKLLKEKGLTNEL